MTIRAPGGESADAGPCAALPPRADGPLHIVLNARSGRGDAAVTRATIERVLAAAGRAHEVLPVSDPRHLADVARQAVAAAQRDDGVVVAAGGDGTINAVAHATLGSGRAFGVLPQGTFNYFSRAHGIPSDTEAATRALLAARVQPVQVGRLNERLFLVNASLGLYPKVLEDREAYKREYGRSRLVALWSALVTLSTAHRPLRLELEGDGGPQRIRTPTLFVGNNALQLEQIGIDDAAALARGALVAITLRPVGTLAMLGLLLRGAVGQLGGADDVFSFSCRRLSVRPAAPMGWRRMKVATDGEIAWLRPPLVFSVAPEPLMLLTPPAGPEPAPERDDAVPAFVPAAA